MIIWRNSDQEWRRYVDYFFIALVVILLSVGIYGVLNWGDDGKVIDTVPAIPGGLFSVPPTTLPERTLPPDISTAETTTSTKRSTTTATPTTMVATTVAPTTTKPRVVVPVPTTPVTAPPATTPPPPPDTTDPSVGSFGTSPSKVKESSCMATFTVSVSVTDASGIRKVTIGGRTASAAGSKYSISDSQGDIAAPGGSTPVNYQVVATDNAGNVTTKSYTVNVFDCA